MPQHEIVNPLLQLARSESLLNQLLLKCGFNRPIEGAVGYIHDEFTLYQAPSDKSIIYPNQMKRYFTKLNNLSSRLGKRHHLLTEKLTSLHISDSPYTQISTILSLTEITSIFCSLLYSRISHKTAINWNSDSCNKT